MANLHIRDGKIFRDCEPCPAIVNAIARPIINLAEWGLADCVSPKVSCIVLRILSIGVIIGTIMGAIAVWSIR